MKLPSSRLFGATYLMVWCALLALLIYFIPSIPKYASIPLGLLLMLLAPDLETLKRLLSGEDQLRDEDDKES